MFDTLDQLVTKNETKRQARQDFLIRWIGGIALAALNFQAIYVGIRVFD
jgi:hypothetical protein